MNNQNQVKLPEVRQDVIDDIEQPGNSAWDDIGKVAANTQYSTDYKLKQVRELKAYVDSETPQRVAEHTAKLTAEVAKLQAVARLPIAPPLEQVPQLEYTRAALAVRWQNMTAPDRYQEWQTAIEAKDTIAARVYRDFLPTVFRQRPDGSPLPVDRQYETLTAQTDDLLSTDDQRKARAALPIVEETLRRLPFHAERQKARFEGMQITQDGKLIDGRSARSWQALRDSF
jgi:hypothetical protein